MILTEKEAEHAWGSGQLHAGASFGSSETGGSPDCDTNSAWLLSACAKHNPPIVHYTPTGDLESQPLEMERRLTFFLFRFYSLPEYVTSLFLLSIIVWCLRLD